MTQVIKSLNGYELRDETKLPLSGGTITGDLNVDGGAYLNQHLYMPNNTGIYGTKPDGTMVLAIEPCAESGNIVVGYGNWKQGSGNLHLYGENVCIFPKAATDDYYTPYFRKGHTIEFNNFVTAGFVTSSAKSVRFFLPLSRPIIGSPTISITSTDGFCLRQWDNYTHGSSSSTYAHPSSYTTALRHGGICIWAQFDDTTNATNNASIGISWSGTITFS